MSSLLARCDRAGTPESLAVASKAAPHGDEFWAPIVFLSAHGLAGLPFLPLGVLKRLDDGMVLGQAQAYTDACKLSLSNNAR